MLLRRCALALVLMVAAGCEVSVGDGSGFGDSGWPDWPDWPKDSDGDGDGADAGWSPRGGSGGSSQGGGAGGSGQLDAGMPDGGKSDAGKPMQPDAGDDAVAIVAGALADGFCRAVQACMGDELALQFLNGNSCVDYLGKQLADRELHWLPESLRGERVGINREQLADCAKAVEAQGCAVVATRLPSTCEEAIAGYVAQGDECSITPDCEGEGVCVKSNQCPGLCSPRSARGGACSASADCESGSVCRAMKCVAAPAEGDPCSTQMTWCAPGLVCQGEPGKESCSTIASVYKARQGEACDAYGTLCVPELVCVSSGGRMGRCEARAQSGAKCGAALPAQCPATDYCRDSATGARVAAGVSGTCAPRPRADASCTSAVGCQPGAVCSAGVCEAYGAAGDSCGGNASCYGGLCSDGECAVAATLCQL